jgi:glycosyltransferase involved in cell wall biosynthesis
MKKLLFIDIEFHTKTQSCRFLLDQLELQFDVTLCRIDQYQDLSCQALSDAAGSYDVLVCWQIAPPREKLDHYFSWTHAALFPMFDSASEDGNPEQWFPYRDFNIICFSKKLFERVSRMGFSAQYIQYFPEPPPVDEWGDTRRVFFWSRQSAIDCQRVEKLLQNMDVKHIHVHKAMDPGQTFIEPDRDGTIAYTFSTWFEDRREMTQLIHESAFYIAPRAKEGIGLSFLEAMAAGRCVIAPNDSTMNEYIEHGKTGFLYELDDPEPIPVSDIKAIQRQARQFVEEGYVRWLRERDTLLDRICTPVVLHRNRLAASIARRTWTRPLSVAKILWKLLFR